LDWANSPVGKTVLLFVGGVALKRWPTFINKAIPVTLLVASSLLSILHAAFPSLTPIASTTLMVTSAPASSWWSTFITTAILPTVAAVGLHSGPKNTLEWAALGFKIFKEIKSRR
jgi:hypothetical protein